MTALPSTNGKAISRCRVEAKQKIKNNKLILKGKHPTKNIITLSFSPHLLHILQLRLQQQLRPPVPPCWTSRVCWACPPACCRSPRTSCPPPHSPPTPAPPSSVSPRPWTTTTTCGAWRTARACRTSSTRTTSGTCCRATLGGGGILKWGGGYLI